MKIGLIGCGDVVESLHLPALAQIPDLKVKWVCDTAAPRAKQLARNWGIKSAFSNLDDCPDVDAVLIATPVGTRESILARTFERGWHALCEKPFAQSADVHGAILDAAREKGVKLGAGFMRRYYWAVEQAHGILRSQHLGSLRRISAGESAHLERTGVDLSSYRNNARASGGGVLMETGCHLIDECLFIADASGAQIEKCSRKTWESFEVETYASGHIDGSDGSQAALEVVISGSRPVFQGIVLGCERGEIRLSLDPAIGMQISFGRLSSRPLELTHPKPGQHLHHVLAAFRSEWKHFADGVSGACEWNMERETGWLTSSVIQQCVESAMTSKIEVTQCAL
jgi:predicted dehydrogenase